MGSTYLPYMGGKDSVVDAVIHAMPPEADSSYIEVFVGGGSILCRKPKARVTIANDIDNDVVLTHQTVAANPQGVMDELQRLPVSRLLYEDIRACRDSAEWSTHTATARAARVIYLHCCAFNANPRSPFVASPMTPLSFDAELDLRPYADRLRGVTFECLEWSELLDRYVLQQKRIRCLVYCDPPYVAATRNAHYRHRFSYLDHMLLAWKLALISEMNGGERSVRIMLTYDDDDSGFIRSIYRRECGWHVQPLPVRYAAGHHTHETQELLITNYEIGDES